MEAKSAELNLVIQKLIELLGLENFLESPQGTATRVADMYKEIFSGTRIDTKNILKPLLPIYENNHTEQLIIINSIPFFSMCEHHFLPFYGFIDICYLPSEYLIGIDKITLLVNALSKRPQLIEHLNNGISHNIISTAVPKGVGVHIAAKQLCTSMRGTKETNQVVHSLSFQGELKTNNNFQNSFMNTLDKSKIF